MLLASASPLPALDAVLDSPWLRRLGRISFLGTLDARPGLHVRCSLLEHCVAVAEEALRVGADAGLDGSRLATFVLAGLLHDVGHYPLSPAAEEALVRGYGGDHHAVTRWILLGEGPVERSHSLREVIEQLRCDPEAVWAVIAGAPQDAVPQVLAGCFTAHLELDALEAVPRLARTFGLARDVLGAGILEVRGSQLVIPSAAVSRADRFWRLADEVSCRVVNTPSNVLFEELVRAAAADLDPRALVPLELLDDQALLSAIGPIPLDLARADEALTVVADEDGARARERYRVDPSMGPGPVGLPSSEWAHRYVRYRERIRVSPAAPRS